MGTTPPRGFGVVVTDLRITLGERHPAGSTTVPSVTRNPAPIRTPSWTGGTRPTGSRVSGREVTPYYTDGSHCKDPDGITPVRETGVLDPCRLSLRRQVIRHPCHDPRDGSSYKQEGHGPGD